MLGFSISMTTDTEIFRVYSGPKFSYNDYPVADEFFVACTDILFDRGIEKIELSFAKYLDLPCFFLTYNKKSVYNFDLFAASFFLLTRYEEYLPFIKDKFGRFSATESIAYQKGFLEKPVVNIWVKDFAEKLCERFPQLVPKRNKFEVLPTIDIDSAWAFKQKGFWRIVGGYLKNLRDRDYQEIKYRTRVLLRKEKDPFDTFDEMIQLHSDFELEAIYFILFADYNEYDKNIPVANRMFQALIRKLADYGSIGIHPSFASSQDLSKLKNEVSQLAEVVHTEISKSRQHFLMLRLPASYHELINCGIKEDYTMGYSDLPGFRAGICTPYFFYDLESEQPSSLKIFPFAVMEGTLKDYMNLDIEQSKNKIFDLIDEVKNVDGIFISLWHNESMSNQKRWVGWDKLYTQILSYAKQKCGEQEQ